MYQTSHKKTRFLEHKFSRIMFLNTGLSLVIVQRIKTLMFAAHVENDHKWPKWDAQRKKAKCKTQKTRMLTAYAKNHHKWPRRVAKAVTSQLRKEAPDHKKWLCFEIRIDFRARILISGTIATTMEGWPPKRWKWSLCVITRLPLNVAAFFLLSKWKSMKSMQLRAKNFLLRAPAGGWEQW